MPPALNKTEKLSAVNAVIKSLNSEYDQVLIQKLGKKTGKRLPSIALDLPTLDEYVLQCGGLPKGRVIEIYGPESAGKTTVALHAIAEAQKAGELAAFVDAEHALDPNYAKVLGVNVDELILAQPDYGEQAIEVVLALVKTRAVGIIVVDSVSALVPKAELEGDMTDASMGVQARLMSKAMRKLCGEVSKAGCAVIFINQVREKIGVMFGNPEVTTGGRALKFFSSVRLEVRRLSKTDGGELKDDAGVHVGHKMRIKNVKNKVGAPFRETVINLSYANGIDTAADWVEYAISIGVLVEGTKGWFTFAGENNRKKDLTVSPLFDTLKSDAKRVRDAALAPVADSNAS